MYIRKNTLFTAILLLLASCSSANNYADIKFNQEKVSCSDNINPEQIAQLKANTHHFMGEEFREHKDEILAAIKKAADNGNAEFMLVWGGDSIANMTVELYSQDKKYNGIITVPDSHKDYVIGAFSYIYAAVEAETKDKATMRETAKKLETGGYLTVKINQEWLDEAKANARHWQEYCLIHNKQKSAVSQW